MMTRRTPTICARLTLAALATGALTLASVTLAGPPPTEIKPVTETIHGTTLTDNYRWLEGDNTDPQAMGAMNEEVAAWTEAQNAYTRSVLDNLPGRAALEDRVRELLEVGFVGAPQMAGNRYFYSKREGDQSQSVVLMRDGLENEPRVLIDPNTLDDKGLYTISWYVPNGDGSLLAFGMYYAGDENSVLYVLDVDTGDWLADEIPGKVSLSGWLPDSSGFFYDRLAELDDPYSGQVRFHRLGTHHRTDPLLIEQRQIEKLYEGSGYSAERLDELRTTYGPFAQASRDGHWLSLGYWTGTRDNDLWIADLDLFLRTGELVKTPIVVGKSAQSFPTIVGDTMFLFTNLDAPNGRVVKIDLFHPEPEHWVELIAERADAVLQGIKAARGVLAATYLKDASTHIELFNYDGSSRGSLELPNIGTASLSTSADRTEAFLTFASWNMPRSIYRVDLATGDSSLWERPNLPVDPSQIEVKQVWYSSKDGTKVSMFLVHKKGLELDGHNPTILYGYGGFSISMTPWFSATMYPWYERGGVYAIANLRGGGEYGKEWHESGRLDRKQNVFDDFIAAGEWLVESGYTNPRQLGIAGGSNGGLLTGACSMQRPDLFRAAIIGVPLLDMIRYQDFLMARYWIPEYGSSEDAAQFEYLLKYSPYQNIRQGVDYPAMLITAGENDARVHPMHARKMAAAVQAATSADPDDKPVLVWVEREAGHGGGKPMWMQVRDIVDQRLFMMTQLGAHD